MASLPTTTRGLAASSLRMTANRVVADKQATWRLFQLEPNTWAAKEIAGSFARSPGDDGQCKQFSHEFALPADP
jgi:hypothetical protein